MIQRIQTLFLLGALILIGLAFAAPAWQFTEETKVEQIRGYDIQLADTAQNQLFFDHQNGSKDATHIAYVALLGVSAVLVILAIFGFNNRPRQARIALFAVFGLMLSILSMVFLTQQPPAYLGMNASSSPAWGFALPVVAMVLTYLAVRNINADEEKVRSMDRIR